MKQPDTFVFSIDSHEINSIINHEDVLEGVLIAGMSAQELDCAVLFTNDGAFAALTPNKDGGVLFVPNYKDKELQAHTFAKKSARGKDMINACRDVCEYLLSDSVGCKKIYGLVPKKNKAAVMFNRLVGFKEVARFSMDRGAGVDEDVIQFERVN